MARGRGRPRRRGQRSGWTNDIRLVLPVNMLALADELEELMNMDSSIWRSLECDGVPTSVKDEIRCDRRSQLIAQVNDVVIPHAREAGVLTRNATEALERLVRVLRSGVDQVSKLDSVLWALRSAALKLVNAARPQLRQALLEQLVATTRHTVARPQRQRRTSGSVIGGAFDQRRFPPPPGGGGSMLY